MGLDASRTSALALVAALILTSCAAGGGDATIGGVSSLRNAKVCLDLDSDLACGPGEPSTISDAQGRYLIGGVPAVFSAPVVAEALSGHSLTYGNRTVLESYRLVSAKGGGEISVWTTLASTLAEEGGGLTLTQAAQQVVSAFGLTPGFDPFTPPPDPEKELLQLTEVCERSLATAQQGAGEGKTPRETVAGAARATFDGAARILAAVNSHRNISSLPPPMNSSPVQLGVFFGDFRSIPISAELAYGIGLDDTTYAHKGALCVGTDYAAYSGLCSNDYNYTFELIESVDELSTHLAIGASATAGVSVAGFDVVSVSGGFDFLKNTEFKDNFLYILFREEHRLCGYPVAPALLPSHLTDYTTDYENFRAQCGDRYMSSITSGGFFVGLVKITVGEDSTVEQLKLTLSGKVMGVTVYKKSWRETMEEISKSYKCETRVFSNIFGRDALHPVDMTGVFELYDQFQARMNNSGCSGPDGWLTCGYTATFSPYSSITDTLPGNAARIEANKARMAQLENYYFEMTDLLSNVDEILLTPGDYNIGSDVDSFTPPNDWSREGLIDWRADVTDYRRNSVAQWNICFANILNCTKSPDELALPPWIDLKDDLPTRKFLFPQDCDSLSDEFGVLNDGEYWLYFAGLAEKDFRAYCADMASGSPQSYLVLPNTSGNIDAPSYNYSMYVNGSGGKLTRTFTSLKFEPRKDPATGKHYLRVLPDQRGQTSWKVTDPLPAGTDPDWVARNLSVLEANAQAGGTARANINLEGTRFAISSATSYAGRPACGAWSAANSPGGQKLELTATGESCNAGSTDMFLLELKP